MDTVEVGQIVRFKRYFDALPGVPEVFSACAALVITTVEPDGVVQCALADYDGRPIHAITDTLFVEELAKLY